MFWTSILVSLGGAAASVGIAIVILIASHFSSVTSRKLVLIWLLGSLFVPSYVVAGAWTTDFGGQAGAWMPTLSPVHLAGKPLVSILAVAWLYCMAFLPLAFLLLRLGISRINFSPWGLAQIESGYWIGILQGFLPVSSAWICISTALIAGLIGTDMFITNLFQVTTVTEYSYQELIAGKDGTNALILNIAVSLSTIFILLLYASQFMKRLSYERMASDPLPPQASIIHSLPVRLFSETILWLLAILVALVPWSNLILKAGWIARSPSIESATEGSATYSWSGLQMMRNLSQVPFRFSEEFYWSGSLGVLAATFAILLGIPATFWIAKRSMFTRKLAVLTLLILFFLPGPFVNHTVLRIMQFDSFHWYNERTLMSPVLCMQFRLVPIAIGWTFWFGIQWTHSYGNTWTIDKSLPIKSRIQILFSPLAWSLARLWVILFVVSFGDLSTYLLCLPPGVTTISMRIFDLLHYGVRFQEAGLLLFIAIVGLVLGYTSMGIREGFAGVRSKRDSSWL